MELKFKIRKSIKLIQFIGSIKTQEKYLVSTLDIIF